LLEKIGVAARRTSREASRRHTRGQEKVGLT
jgi:hypothetical protein